MLAGAISHSLCAESDGGRRGRIPLGAARNENGARTHVVASAVATVSFLIGGALYFRRMEAQFADVV